MRRWRRPHARQENSSRAASIRRCERASDSEVGSEAADVRIDPVRRTVSGEVTSGNFCGYLNAEDRRSYYTLHVVAVFDRPFASWVVWRDGAVIPTGVERSGGTGYGEKGFPEVGRGSGASFHTKTGLTRIPPAEFPMARGGGRTLSA